MGYEKFQFQFQFLLFSSQPKKLGGQEQGGKQSSVTKPHSHHHNQRLPDKISPALNLKAIYFDTNLALEFQDIWGLSQDAKNNGNLFADFLRITHD